MKYFKQNSAWRFIIITLVLVTSLILISGRLASEQFDIVPGNSKFDVMTIAEIGNLNWSGTAIINQTRNLLEVELMRPRSIGSILLLLWGGFAFLIWRALSGRKPVMKTVRNGETDQASILNVVTDSIVNIDHQTRVKSFNQAAEHFFGYSNSEVLDRPIYELIDTSKHYFTGLIQQLESSSDKPPPRITIHSVANTAHGQKQPIDLIIIPHTLGDQLDFSLIIQTLPRVTKREDAQLFPDNPVRNDLSEGQPISLESPISAQIEYNARTDSITFPEAKLDTNNQEQHMSNQKMSSDVGYPSQRLSQMSRKQQFWPSPPQQPNPSTISPDFVALKGVIFTILQWWWLLLLSTVILASAGYWASLQQDPVYEATTTLAVGQILQATELNRSDIQTMQVLAGIYADMARREPVLQNVIDILELERTWVSLKSNVQVSLQEGSQLFTIQVESDSPEVAKAIVAEVANQLVRLSPAAQQNQNINENHEFLRVRTTNLRAKIEEGQNQLTELEMDSPQTNSPEAITQYKDEIKALEELIMGWERNYTQMLALLTGETSPNTISVIEPAQADPEPVRPRPLLNTFIAGIIGFVLALGFVFLRELLDDTLKSEKDLSQVLGVQTLGAIKRIKGKTYQDRLLLYQDVFSSVTEEYRIIRSNIQFFSFDRPLKTLLITSANSGEGKSVNVANLAIVMAQAGFKTIVVDADLRHPKQHEIFQVPNQSGLTDLLSREDLSVQDYLHTTPVRNLQLLPSGQLPQNPAELLGSRLMGQVLSQLNEIADLVIFDSPALLPVTDGAVLSSWVDAVLMVGEAGLTRRASVGEAVARLRYVGAPLLGGILNEAKTSYSYNKMDNTRIPISPEQSNALGRVE